MFSRARAAAALLGLLVAPARAGDGGAPAPDPAAGALDVRSFRPVEGPSSGPEVYYEVVDGPDGALIRGTYRPGLETVTMGVEVPEPLRRDARRLRWRWRARALPAGGDECQPGLGDSAASVLATFKRGFRWYVLKYVWSPVAPRGAVCDRKRGLFLVRDTVVLESGGPTGVWKAEEVDLRRDFRDHFEEGNPGAEVPDLLGVGILTDGDQTHSPSGADWAGFEVLP